MKTFLYGLKPNAKLCWCVDRYKEQRRVRDLHPRCRLGQLLQLSLPSPGVHGGTATDLPSRGLVGQTNSVLGPTNKDV